MPRLGGMACGLLLMMSAAGAARAQARDSQEFALSVHGLVRESEARAEQAAWVSLTVPLAELAAPRAATSARSRQAPPPAVADDGEPEPAPAESPPLPQPRLDQLRALAELSRRATGVALAVVGASAERRRLDGLSARARASALLPELRLRALRTTDQALRGSPTVDDPYRVTQADGAGITLEASATFRLDRLLFSREELVVERLRAQAASERLKLERQVLDALLELYRARELACLEDVTDEARALSRIRAVQLAAELDVLTAGWFAEQAPRFARAVWGFPEALLGVCSAPAPAPSPGPAATNPVASLEESE